MSSATTLGKGLFPPAAMPFQIYADGFDPRNHYVPSGYMGDVRSVRMNQAWTSVRTAARHASR